MAKKKKVFDDITEPSLDEMREFFKKNKNIKCSVSSIICHLGIGYSAATKAFNQLKKK